MSHDLIISRIAEVTGFSPSIVETIRDTVAKGASNEELQVFSMICSRTKLDPFTRQIYFMKTTKKSKDASGKWSEKDVMTVMTGIDGYRAVAERSGTLAGIDDVVYDAETDDHPNKATVTVHRIVNGERVQFTASARWKEYAQMKEEWVNGQKTGKLTPSGQWGKMPYLMLGKCAEALALRKAFPNDLSGVYTKEEMDQAENPTVIETVTPPREIEAQTIEQPKPPVTPPTPPAEPVEVTANGNPKGSINETQLKRIHAIIGDGGADLERMNQFIEAHFGKRISGLSEEQADRVIELLAAKLKEKKHEGANEEVPPPAEDLGFDRT